ncbi:MAG: hypothetical protein ACTS3F_11010 [Phycisphaerales bacterium]
MNREETRVWLRACCVAGLAGVGVMAVPGRALACGQPPPVEPPKTWQVLGGEGSIELYVELGTIFPTSTPHACSCGIGLGSAGAPLPFGVDVNDIRLGILTRTDGQVVGFDPILAFDVMGADGNSTTGWQNGPVIPDPALGSPVPGSTWFGFGGVVGAVDPGTPQANQSFVICFDLKFDPGLLQGTSTTLQIGAGLGVDLGNFAPLFDSGLEHTARYSTPVEIEFVPSPGGVGVLALGGLFAARRRR